MKNGYADFRVVSATADLDRERNVFFVAFTVDGRSMQLRRSRCRITLRHRFQGAVLLGRHRSGDVYSIRAVEDMEELTMAATAPAIPSPRSVRATRDYANRTSITPTHVRKVSGCIRLSFAATIAPATTWS